MPNQKYLQEREKGFSLGNPAAVKLKDYNALYDPNMRHYFESKHTQLLLYKTGQIDQFGRVIDYEKNKSKLVILEREFKAAEKIEEQRQKDEMEMRYRVQKKRFNELEKQRKNEILESLRAERELSKEITKTLQLSTGANLQKSASMRKSTSFLEKTGEGFFITEK